MKSFEIPEIEIIYIGQKDIITASTCPCVDCTECPYGKDNCQYKDNLQDSWNHIKFIEWGDENE